MAKAFSVEKKTIGTASRDFVTITLWEATLSGDTNNDTNQIGEVFADSVFDERPVISAANQQDGRLENPILVAAPGQRPVIKPVAPFAGFILLAGMNDLQIIGLTFDGTNQTAGNGVATNAGNLRQAFVGCEARNCVADGFFIEEPALMAYCLSHNNTGKGFKFNENAGLCYHCGAAKNGLTGFEGQNANSLINLIGCWSLDNTGDDFEHVTLTVARFCYASDTSITDQGAPTHTLDIFESQVSGSLGFTNFAANDFTLAAGSSLRQKGSRFAHRFLGVDANTSFQMALQDVFTNNLEADVGDRLDVGPHQPSLKDAGIGAIPSAPTLTGLTAGNTQVIAAITAAAEANTQEVFYFTVGGAPTSGGTRVGSGNITVTGMTNGTTYLFFVQEKNASGVYGPSSNILAATPRAADDDPAGAIPAFLDSMRDLYTSSANFLAWINTVNGGETTSGHVRLGWRPHDMIDVKTKGPHVSLSWENLRVEDAGSAKAFRAYVDIVAQHAWASAGPRAADEFIEEMSYIDKIVNEMADTIGITLNSTYGGHLMGISAADSLVQSPRNPGIWYSEMRYTIGYGYSR